MKVYKKGDVTSYTLGVFPTIELLKNKPNLVKRVVVHSSIVKNSGYPLIQKLCKEHNIMIEEHDKTIEKLSPKNNCYAIGVFDIKENTLEEGNHVVLVNPMDKGNIGTIMRTMLGFGYRNLAIVRPAVNIYDPHVVRASMGAMFSLNIEYFDTFDEYYQRYQTHQMYPLMLKGAKNIYNIEEQGLHTLIFGNESSGLDDEYLNYGQSVFIPHSDAIDSLNLSMAVGLTMFHFAKEDLKGKEVLR